MKKFVIALHLFAENFCFFMTKWCLTSAAVKFCEHNKKILFFCRLVISSKYFNIISPEIYTTQKLFVKNICTKRDSAKHHILCLTDNLPIKKIFETKEKRLN